MQRFLKSRGMQRYAEALYDFDKNRKVTRASEKGDILEFRQGLQAKGLDLKVENSWEHWKKKKLWKKLL